MPLAGTCRLCRNVPGLQGSYCSACYRKELSEQYASQTALHSETKKLLSAREKESMELQSRLKLETEKLQSRLNLETVMLEKSQSRLKSQTKTSKDLQLRLNFLRQRLDDANGDGAMRADVSILVEDRIDDLLHAHKFVLAGKSPVFCKMFEINMREGETGLVRIDDATLPVMRAVIEFCYNAEINFTDKVTPEEVLEVAHKYGIDLLVQTCEKLLIQTIDEVNLRSRLKLAKKFEVKMLHARALEYLKTHFDNVINAVEDELF